jgi:phage tail P2-like protein
MSLLPPNSTALERAFETVIAKRIDAIPVPIRDLLRPDSCPEPVLAWLAWEESVDVWDDEWPEATKRAVIAAAYEVHVRKGTIGAMRRALAALNIGLEIREWFETGDPRGTFRIDAFADTIFDAGLGIDQALVALVSAQIDNVKRASLHYSLRVGERFKAKQPIRAGARIKARQSMTLSPRPEADVEDAGVSLRAGFGHRMIHRATVQFAASNI